ncbi:BspA family leucine-rich repeat surface protein [Mesoplasma seiffertii]|uniref:BspA family leucine-rich repeat surface protein n=1 Tax=Mesoplasma seiffertii TaxID=28224 RepID=UPI0006877D55|nr:BspA family leucine-rich repeat surface protein [Mesoplasma seiffertii]
MKKLLTLLGAVGLTATAGATVVACGNPEKNKNQPVDITLFKEEAKKLATGSYKTIDEAVKAIEEIKTLPTGIGKIEVSIDKENSKNIEVKFQALKGYETPENLTLRFQAEGAKILTEIDIHVIQKTVQEQFVEELDTIDAVNEKLKSISNEIEGVASLTAELKPGSDTTVVVNVKVDENTHYIIGDSSFELENAIKEPTKVTQMPTIYINSQGNKVSTNDTNLSSIQSKEIVQIGFYKVGDKEIRGVKMPKSVEKVPASLPSQITSLEGMFMDCSNFNQDLSTWDVKNVTDMSGTFFGASKFDKNISEWNVSNVTDMGSMFNGATVFNQDLSKWDVSNVTNMQLMFRGTTLFNQNLSKWNVKNVQRFDNFDENSAKYWHSSMKPQFNKIK